MNQGSANPRLILAAKLRGAVPPGRVTLSTHELQRLRDLTQALVASREAPSAEYTRFLEVRERVLRLPLEEVRRCIEGSVVLVVGGTGCIGSGVVGRLRELEPKRIVTLSRGVSPRWEAFADVQHLDADLRDARAIDRAVARIRPDIVFHVGAQRDPGLAERHPLETISTNVQGTRNLVAASAASGVSRFVYASTGKALRLLTPHVYASTKRVGEWLVAEAARHSPMEAAVVRFTHVVDNSIVAERFRVPSADGVLRIHDPDIGFYVQSRSEAAQLLLLAAVPLAPAGTVPLLALRDVGSPVSLIELAAGIVAAERPEAALYVSGYDPGYLDPVYPGLYDPETAVDVSPLFNALEAHSAHAATCENVDQTSLRVDADEGLNSAVASLDRLCDVRASDEAIRAGLWELSLGVLRGALAPVEVSLLLRVLRLAEPHRHQFSLSDRLVDETIRAAAKRGPAAQDVDR